MKSLKEACLECKKKIQLSRSFHCKTQWHKQILECKNKFSSQDQYQQLITLLMAQMVQLTSHKLYSWCWSFICWYFFSHLFFILFMAILLYPFYIIQQPIQLQNQNSTTHQLTSLKTQHRQPDQPFRISTMKRTS